MGCLKNSEKPCVVFAVVLPRNAAVSHYLPIARYLLSDGLHLLLIGDIGFPAPFLKILLRHLVENRKGDSGDAVGKDQFVPRKVLFVVVRVRLSHFLHIAQFVRRFQTVEFLLLNLDLGSAVSVAICFLVFFFLDQSDAHLRQVSD